MTTTRTIVVLLSVLIAVLSCDDPSGFDDPCPDDTPELPPPDVADVPDTTSACGGVYVLECYLWRDFMPIAPPDGDPLRAAIHLVDVDSLAVADSLALEHLWVIDAPGYWSTGFEPGDIPAPEAHTIGRLATCGPKWEPGILVDVVVRFRCGGEPYLLRARDVVIDATF